MPAIAPNSKRRTASGRFAPDPVNGQPIDERTGDQHEGISAHGLVAVPSGFLWANGGCMSNPMGYPGYGFGYTGSFATYRWMLQHPILQLVRSICTSIIVANVWEYVWNGKEGTENEPWIEAVMRTFDRLRQSLMEDFFIRGRDYGRQCGEVIWTAEDGAYDIVRVKPLVNEATEFLQDEFGNVVGVLNSVKPRNRSGDPLRVQSGNGVVGGEGQPDGVRLFAPYKAWWYTYDGENGDPQGRSWLENCRSTAWKDWLDCMQQLQKLGAKISGVVTVVMSPAGTFQARIDGATKEIQYSTAAKKFISALAAGAAGGWFPTISLAQSPRGNLDFARTIEKLASITKIDVMDFGSNAAAIAPILDRMKHAEELMFAAGHRSARVGLEAEHGTKEEAGVHTDTGTIRAEVEDQNFAVACQPLIDAYLTANFGPRAKGMVSIKPPSLIDRKTSILRVMLAALMNEPAIRLQVSKMGVIDHAFDTLDISYDTAYDADAAIKFSEKAKEPAVGEGAGGKDNARKNPEPEGGRPAKAKE